jgi:hypothetical protein
VVDANCIRRLNDHHYSAGNDDIDEYFNFLHLNNCGFVNFVNFAHFNNCGFVN